MTLTTTAFVFGNINQLDLCLYTYRGCSLLVKENASPARAHTKKEMCGRTADLPPGDVSSWDLERPVTSISMPECRSACLL